MFESIRKWRGRLFWDISVDPFSPPYSSWRSPTAHKVCIEVGKVVGGVGEARCKMALKLVCWSVLFVEDGKDFVQAEGVAAVNEIGARQEFESRVAFWVKQGRKYSVVKVERLTLGSCKDTEGERVPART